jgi:general secretion pathway protein D
VNDNEEATIASIRQEPTTTTSLGGGGEGSRDVTSFGGYEDAGTTLTVTPRISEGGYLRLEYEVQLSAFDGTGSDGIPPPKIENNVASSASLPTDFTIVVGGIEVDTKRKTVVKVPLLGDIPLFGHLFRDTNKNDATTRLYVFITPKIMRDETFDDLRLLTRGPYAKSELEDPLPGFEPSVIPLMDASGDSAGSDPWAAPASMPLDDGEPDGSAPSDGGR